MIDFVVDLVEEHVDLDGYQLFWIGSRTLVLCAYFTTECGSPGIRKSMSASFTIIDSWLTSWSATGLSVLSRSVSSPTLNVSLSWAERVWETVWHIKSRHACHQAAPFAHVPVQRWNPSCLQMKMFGCLDYSRLVNGFSRNGSRKRSPRSLWRTRFFAKRINIDLLRTGRFSSILHTNYVMRDIKSAPISHDLDLELLGLIGNF